MMTSCVKAVVLAAAILGYASLFQKRKLPLCFFPIAFVSGVSLTLYGFGFFSALKVGCYAILLCGVLMLLVNHKHFQIRALKRIIADPVILFCIVSCIWLFAITRGAALSHWDDGSHWYRICKSMYVEGAFPTTPDILYYNYVPGCQLWVYFVLQFVDFSMQGCMFAQGLINIACVAVLFAGLRGARSLTEKAFLIAIAAAGAVGLCSMDIGTYALLVDLQLGMTAMALLILLLDQGERTDALVLAGILCSFLLLIKNSAVFFALTIFLWALVRYRWKGKKLLGCAFGLVGIPLVLRCAYAVRAGIVYASGAASPQSISLERFGEMLALKDAESLAVFTKRFLFKLFIGDTGLSMAVYVCIGLLALLIVCLHLEGRKEEMARVRLNLFFGLGMLAAYAVMLYGTYLLTMSVGEMTSVNSFYRYFGSMVIVFAGMTVYTAMVCGALPGREPMTRLCVLSMILFAVLAMPGAYSKRFIWGHGRVDPPDNYSRTLWRTMSYVLPENRRYTDAHYVVLWNPAEFSDGILYNQQIEYAIGAWLRSACVDAVPVNEFEHGLSQARRDALASCDYLVFLSDLSQERELLAPYFDTEDFTTGIKEN